MDLRGEKVNVHVHGAVRHGDVDVWFRRRERDEFHLLCRLLLKVERQST